MKTNRFIKAIIRLFNKADQLAIEHKLTTEVLYEQDGELSNAQWAYFLSAATFLYYLMTHNF